MLRVVFDTVVFVRALINPHGLWGRLIFGHSEDYHLILSQPVIEEILEVIDRPVLKSKYRLLEVGGIQSVLDIITQAEVVEASNVPHVSRDPKDDKFLATARAAEANYLVSEDTDLLDLREHEGIAIVDARTFIEILEESV